MRSVVRTGSGRSNPLPSSPIPVHSHCISLPHITDTVGPLPQRGDDDNQPTPEIVCECKTITLTVSKRLENPAHALDSGLPERLAK